MSFSILFPHYLCILWCFILHMSSRRPNIQRKDNIPHLTVMMLALVNSLYALSPRHGSRFCWGYFLIYFMFHYLSCWLLKSQALNLIESAWARNYILKKLGCSRPSTLNLTQKILNWMKNYAKFLCKTRISGIAWGGIIVTVDIVVTDAINIITQNSI